MGDEMQSANDTIRAQYEAAIAEFSIHVARTADGTFQLNVKDAKEIGMDQVVFADLQRSLETTNHLIKRGEIRADQVLFP